LAVTAHVYRNFLRTLLAKDVDLDVANEVKVMLCTSLYVPNQNTHEFKSDVTNEVTGTGYVAGGIVLPTPVQITTTNFIWAFDGGDAVWPASTITARFAVVYDNLSGGVDTARRLIMWQDFGVDVSSTGGNFTITWATAGLFQATFS
jgi:hypothetical protein